MDLEQQIDISGTVQEVWTALNDPAVLQRCLPGCERFELIGENRFEIEMAVKVGPVKARFAGTIELTDIDEPFAYTISGSGKGGVAGFASGSARVTLAALDTGTRLSYTVAAKVGGKLAQLGARLIDGAAKKIAGDFFRRFQTELQQLAASPRQTG